MWQKGRFTGNLPDHFKAFIGAEVWLEVGAPEVQTVFDLETGRRVDNVPVYRSNLLLPIDEPDATGHVNVPAQYVELLHEFAETVLYIPLETFNAHTANYRPRQGVRSPGRPRMV